MRRQDGPIYARIERDLRGSIARGELRLGTRIPTEEALSTRYGVSRMTVRQALERLASAGLLTRRQGVGTFVAKTKIERVASRLLGFREDAVAHGLTPATRVLDEVHGPVGDEDAAALDLDADATVFRVRRLRTTDGDPIGLNTIVLLPDVAEELDGADYTLSLYDEVARLLGADVARADQTVEATLADDTSAGPLRVSRGAPLLRVTRVTYLSTGRLIGLTRTLYRGDRYFLSLALTRDGPTTDA